ncbi:MAG: Mur ligase family protein [Candidatus Dormibacteraeota bacterium]|nr:Mur ligase family protein [Candidatus Dormibacteraeota bacterium]
MAAEPALSWPAAPAHVHLLGICGYAVSGLALALAELGYLVTGADEDAYPPTTDILRDRGIEFATFHDAANLDRWETPAVVILGNQVQPGNRELEGALARGLQVVSEAEAQGLLASARTRAVVCGTHGKTTTSSLLALMLEGAGLRPGFRLGSTSRDFGCSVRLGDLRTPFVFEGDEYSTSALDRRAKFLHWHPHIVTLLNLELDHPDLYPDLQAYLVPYRELLAQLPGPDRVLVNGEDQLARELSLASGHEVQTWGGEGSDWRLLGAPRVEGRRQALTIQGPDGLMVKMRLPMFGRHNASNALGALATAVALGADPDAAAAAVEDFQGAARRFEIVGELGGVTVVDDYAHHPTKLRATIAAARQWMGEDRQLILVHVPHTYSRTLALLDDYETAFLGADLVVLGPIEPARERALAGAVSSADVAARVRGAEVVLVSGAAEAAQLVRDRLRPPALVVCSSVRGFDQVAARILGALA